MRFSVRWLYVAALSACILSFASCSDKGSGGISFGEPGSFSQASGKGSFVFGAASAATQIEDQNTNTDWYQWSLPKADGGRGEGTEFVGDAVGSYSHPELDLDAIKALGLDSYRFSIEWARIEPEPGVYDQEAIQHYSDFIDELVAMGVRPNVTLFHFSNPLWVTGKDFDCGGEGPTEEHLCGWDDPDSADQIVEHLADFAALMAKTFGDRVDDWATFNEPVNYILAAYGQGIFPPGRNYLIQSIGKDASSKPFQTLVSVFRTTLRAHVAMYNAIKENDTVDADADGSAADVGMTLNTIDWIPTVRNQRSDDEINVSAAERITYFYHYLMIDSLLNGTFDPMLTGDGTEPHPDWTGKIDWLGVQYYFHSGVTGAVQMIPGVDLMICFSGLDFGSCLPVDKDMHKWIPTMGYEYSEVGLYNVIRGYSERYPNLPMVVTETGIAAKNSARRTEVVVRTLEQIHRAIEDGSDVRGLYIWSLTDNFEWQEGYGPHFGLFRVDHDDPTFTRVPTQAVPVYRDIIESRKISDAQHDQYGGTGPLSPETDTFE